jgi:hypothetical protein
MADNRSVGIKGDEPSPLHELISQILGSDESSQGRSASGLPMLGTMQYLSVKLLCPQTKYCANVVNENKLGHSVCF